MAQPAASSPQQQASTRQFLRHAIATLAYRGGKAIRGAPDSFAEFSGGTNTPAKILAHIGDLLDWMLGLCEGRYDWHDSQPLPWPQEKQRFFAALKKVDDFLASELPIKGEIERIFQGPLADALTHVGQLTMLRRMAGCPMKSESYYKADIRAGKVCEEQTPSRFEFD